MKEEKITHLLITEFNGVYCDTCQLSHNINDCGDCHRKNMNWELCHVQANKLAVRIIKILEESK